MAKYNFWVRTTKQTNHPMKGIEMEFGDCLQMFNDYINVLRNTGHEIIDAEIYRIIEPAQEYRNEDEKLVLDAICKEIDATGSKAFGYEALLKYEGVTPAMLGGVLIDMRRRGKIVSCEDGLMFAEDVEPVNIISTCTHK